MHRRVGRVALAATAATAMVSTVGVATSASAAAKQPSPLRILVTNDDGYAAPGIDAVVEGLRTVPGVKLTVIAPAEDKTLSGSATTTGALATKKTKTTSGFPALAVAGFPADAVVYALDQGGLAKKPNLVISGINKGQNVGLGIATSGTVGAARAAATRGIPALAVSQGTRPGATPDYEAGVKQVLRWLRSHRKELTPKGGKTVRAVLRNLNVPSCGTGHVRGVVEVPVAGNDVPGFASAQNCSSTLVKPANDVEGLVNGFATVSELPVP